jgi:septum formation protein
MLKFILASNSSRRKQILSSLGIKFISVPHRYKEPKIKNHHLPEKFVEEVAINKAKSLKKEYNDYVIISADTIVVLNNEIIGKPKDHKEAEEILIKLSNTKHRVYTGLCLYYPKKNLLFSDVEKSTVYTYKLEEEKIKELSKKHLDKAGAYAVQEKNDRFVKKIIGDYYNVVGFPVFKFLNLYKKLLIKLIRG